MKPIHSKNRFLSATYLVLFIWAISLINLIAIAEDLFTMPPLVPRSIEGLIGISTMPFIHGNLSHLISNTLPIITFSIIISFKGNKYFLKTTLSIMLLSGIFLWVFGRTGAHIGASMLIFGYFGFLLVRVIYDRKFITAVISIAVALLYGGLIWGVLPQDSHISWEGHLCGLISGLFTARHSNHKS